MQREKQLNNINKKDRWSIINIEKMIEEIGKAFAKIIFNKKEKSSEKINIDQMSSTDIFKIIFNKLFHGDNYNKAEDLIFDELEKNNSLEVYEVAIEFYNSLLKKSDEELNKNNFPRKEIYQGLGDIQKFKIDSEEGIKISFIKEEILNGEN